MLILGILILTFNAHASLGEFFGSSAKSQAIAGQSSFEDASANYYGASSLAFTIEGGYSISLTRVQMNFTEINNVLVESEVNSNSSSTISNAEVDYEPQEIWSIHAAFPLFNFNKSKFGFSVFAPLDRAVEAGTGDAYLPEYSLYRNRFLRTVFHVNYIQPIGDSYGLSIGFVNGIKSEGKTYVVASDGGSTPSSGEMGFNAKPTYSLALSLSKRWDSKSKSYFSFQDEAKSEIENDVSGLTPIGASSLQYSWDMSALLFYDPRIYRLGHQKSFESSTLTATIEYQDWSGYESPRLNLKNDGGVLVSSESADNFTLNNIWVPKISWEKSFETWSFQSGLSYRPSPLDMKDDKAGNQVDTDAAILGLGAEKALRFDSDTISIQVAAQYQHLIEKTVEKTGPRENGSAGDKIGSPSYKVGGNVFTISAGISWGL